MIVHGFFDRILLAMTAGGEQATEQVLEHRRQRLRQSIIHWRRELGVWWLPIVLVLVGGGVGSILGPLVLAHPKEVIGGLVGIVAVAVAMRRLHVGLFLLGFLAAPFAPKVISIKSLDVYPVEILLFALACAILVRVAFRVRPYVWPALETIWPLVGLVVLALVSSVAGQATWLPQVPRTVGSSPVLYSEIVGVLNLCMPLAIVLVTCACLGHSEERIRQLLTMFIVLAVVGSVVILVEFKRVGADVYAFRYTEEAILYGQPAVFFMSLGDLAQLVGIGAIIAYTRLLHTDTWQQRCWYGVACVLCLASLYVTLENSRWLEVAIALVLITIVFSRRLFLILCACALPLLPVGIIVAKKLVALKSGDFIRIIIWQDVLRVWQKRPLLGVGPGNLWSYDQVFTHLPPYLRDFGQTGLGVAHNGLLQLLGEVGPLGDFFAIAFGVIIAVTSVRLLKRSQGPEQRDSRILGLVCLGFVFGALAGDIFSGDMFIPPGQIGGFNDLPHVFLTWILFSCLLYQDQLARTAQVPRRVIIHRASETAHHSAEVGAIPWPA